MYRISADERAEKGGGGCVKISNYIVRCWWTDMTVTRRGIPSSYGIDPHTNNSQNDKAAKTAIIEIIRTVSSSDTIKIVLQFVWLTGPRA